MALSNFGITYDTDPAIFFPGKSISGKVIFTVLELSPYDQLRIECHGSASTKRTKTVTSTNGFMKTIIYSANEIYCHQEKILLDLTKRSSISADDLQYNSRRSSSHGETNQTTENGINVLEDEERSIILARQTSSSTIMSMSMMKPGDYTFPFMFTLPIKCPGSFEGSYGQIRYFCTATITCNGAIRCIVKVPFTVISWMDLNYSPTAVQHFQTEAHSSIDEKGGKILARLYLRQQGYVAGEMINARMEIVNNGTKAISSIFAQFVQRINYSAKRQNAEDWNKWEERKVLQQAIRKEKVASNKNSLLKWELFAVPPCCPTMLIDVNIIRIQYEIQLHFILDGNVPGLVLIAPVIVGSIPLKHTFDELRVVYLRQPGENVLSNSYGPLMERYPDIPIPTYKPQLIDPVDIREPSDYAFLSYPIHFWPLSLVYDNTKPTEMEIDKRNSRKTNKEETRQRSRSTISRFSFRTNPDNSTITPSTVIEKDSKIIENMKNVENVKNAQEDAKNLKKEENEAPKTKETKKWGRKKTADETPSKSESKSKSKKEKGKDGVANAKTCEQPTGNGTVAEKCDSSGGEEFF